MAKLQFGLTMRARNKRDPDPFKRYDSDVEVSAPMRMHFKMENGRYSYLSSSGEWVHRRSA